MDGRRKLRPLDAGAVTDATDAADAANAAALLRFVGLGVGMFAFQNKFLSDFRPSALRLSSEKLGMTR